ncbi:MAG: ATP-binding protein [Candidatus Micrarchaeota archaeon]
MISTEELTRIINEEKILTKAQIGVIREKYLTEIMPFLNRKEVIIIKGIRRSGKSTIMKQMMDELVKKGTGIVDILYINLEDYRLIDHLDLQLLEQLLEFRANQNARFYLFIDEVQLISKWEKWVRTHYDKNKNIKFIISGSCASLLDKEYAIALTGRNITFQIKPLSFTEFIIFKKDRKPEKLLKEYLELGGFPEVVLEENIEMKKRLLKQYMDDILNKDIINRHNVRDAKQVLLLAKYLTSNVGQKISFNKIAKAFGLSVETVIHYIQYMIDAYLINEVPFHSYSIKVKYDQKKQPKYYIADNGLINIMDIEFSRNLNKKYENAVFLKLSEKYNLTYWQDENEVDFIFENTGINVTAADKIAARELEGLKKLKERDKNIKTTLLVTPNTSKQEGKINIIPLLNFLICSI